MAAVADLIVASASVKGGRLLIRNRRQFDAQIAQLRDGTQLELTAQTLRATRSIQANAYLWGVVYHYISEHTGDTPDDLHLYFKQRLLPKRLGIRTDGEESIVPGSTRKLNTKEFAGFVEAVRQFAAEFLDCQIPDPDLSGSAL